VIKSSRIRSIGEIKGMAKEAAVKIIDDRGIESLKIIKLE
jgi:hypothetical protein